MAIYLHLVGAQRVATAFPSWEDIIIHMRTDLATSEVTFEYIPRHKIPCTEKLLSTCL